MTHLIPNMVSGPQLFELASILDTQRLPNEMLEHVFHFLNAEELAKTATVCQLWNALASSDAVSYEIPFPSWLKDIDADIWRKLDLKKYGLDISEVPRVNRRALTKALKPLSRKVENKMGITNMVIPKGLTLNIVLQIAKDNSVPIAVICPQSLAELGDIAVEQTRVLFFTNSVFVNTRKHTIQQQNIDLKTIEQECGIAIQWHEFRSFIAFLVLTYINSSETPPTQLYPSKNLTRLMEKVNDSWRFFIGGFPSFGLYVHNCNHLARSTTGVGAFGSSENIL